MFSRHGIRHSGFNHAEMRINQTKHCPKCGSKVQRKGLCTQCKRERKQQRLDNRYFKRDLQRNLEELEDGNKK